MHQTIVRSAKRWLTTPGKILYSMNTTLSHSFSTNLSSYATFFITLLMLRAIDLFLTYQITPDLSLEWNPIVVHFNLDWNGFMSIQLFLVFVGLLGYHRYAQRIRNPIEKPGMNPFQFVFYYFNGKDLSFKNFSMGFIRMPNKRRARMSSAFIGFVIASSFLLVSSFAILHNILILSNNEFYAIFVHKYNSYYLPTVYISLVLISAIAFLSKEYFSYKYYQS